MDIMVITEVERTDIEFISRTLGCMPVAHVDSFTPEKLGSAELVTEVTVPGGSHKVVKITGVQNPGNTMSILIRGSNKLVLEEADRSLHDALCVVRSLVKKRFLIAGGGAAETEVNLRLSEWAKTQKGMMAYCVAAFAQSLEVIPYTLAENAGLNPIAIVTELRRRHSQGEAGTGINVRANCISDSYAERVVQPLLVSLSAMTLAAECVYMISKIDDLIPVAR